MVLAAALLSAACGSRDTVTEELATRTVVLPGGQEIRAEVKFSAEQMKYGMMFRESLPRDRGMLFVHKKPGAYSYWMHNMRIPLDIVFMSDAEPVLIMGRMSQGFDLMMPNGDPMPGHSG